MLDKLFHLSDDEHFDGLVVGHEFEADPDDPKNYTFAKTDDYLAAILRSKPRIICRLGESIEPWTHYHNHPPMDFQKWARICVNIIRHYNEGWAGGFHHDIQYWEIWNEPEGSGMWTGTREQYFELYETAARAIKAHDASLKVGGPAATHINSELVRPFLAWCRDRRLPLDFLSWHAYYGVPEYLARDAATARKLLDEHGFQSAESHPNEWRYLTTWSGLRPSEPKEYATVPEWFGRSCRAEGAAFCATVLLRLQDSPVDVVCFYTADTSAWSMFGQFGIPTKVFYAFKAFNQLAALSDRVACDGPMGQGIAACAGLAADKKNAAVLRTDIGRQFIRTPVDFVQIPARQQAQRHSGREGVSCAHAIHDLHRRAGVIGKPGLRVEEAASGATRERSQR
jgi:hypothetical protein